MAKAVLQGLFVVGGAWTDMLYRIAHGVVKEVKMLAITLILPTEKVDYLELTKLDLRLEGKHQCPG